MKLKPLFLALCLFATPASAAVPTFEVNKIEEMKQLVETVLQNDWMKNVLYRISDLKEIQKLRSMYEDTLAMIKNFNIEKLLSQKAGELAKGMVDEASNYAKAENIPGLLSASPLEFLKKQGMFRTEPAGEEEKAAQKYTEDLVEKAPLLLPGARQSLAQYIYQNNKGRPSYVLDSMLDGIVSNEKDRMRESLGKITSKYYATNKRVEQKAIEKSAGDMSKILDEIDDGPGGAVKAQVSLLGAQMKQLDVITAQLLAMNETLRDQVKILDTMSLMQSQIYGESVRSETERSLRKAENAQLEGSK